MWKLETHEFRLNWLHDNLSVQGVKLNMPSLLGGDGTWQKERKTLRTRMKYVFSKFRWLQVFEVDKQQTFMTGSITNFI